MADIKMCPSCGGRPTIIRKRDGYRWIHRCKKTENMKFTGQLFDKFGDAVRDWNTRVKNIREFQNRVNGG